MLQITVLVKDDAGRSAATEGMAATVASMDHTSVPAACSPGDDVSEVRRN